MIPTASMSGTLPVLSCTEAAIFEKDFFFDPKNDETVFMQRAAQGIANEVESLFAEIRARPIRAVLVLAGKGHNAADALIAARLLHERHRCSVAVLLAQSPEKMAPAAARALHGLLALGARVRLWRDDHDADVFLGEDADVLLDGLLGYNFQPPLRAPFTSLITWANRRAGAFLLRVAVDLPSGMGDANDTGAAILQVDATVACGILKTPLLATHHAALRGRVRFADIGFPADLPGRLRAGGVGLLKTSPLRRLRPSQSDKRHFGHLFILGGSRTLPGALLMNVRAALRTGVGLLTVFCPESVHAAFAAAAPEAMWIPWPETPDGTLALEGEHLLREKLPRATALLCGSGMGDTAETHALLQSVVARTPCPLVLDADALRADILEAAAKRPEATPLILLPHAGEFARIAETAPLRDACARFRACIALKGAPTRVADAEREIVICVGGPILARGGSGDLLAGMAGALFARRLHDDPLHTLATAVAWHGAAADRVARERGAEAAATTDLLAGLDPALRG